MARQSQASVLFWVYDIGVVRMAGCRKRGFDPTVIDGAGSSMAKFTSIPPAVVQCSVALSEFQPMRRGSLGKRHMKCGKAGCPCHQEAKPRQGPAPGAPSGGGSGTALQRGWIGLRRSPTGLPPRAEGPLGGTAGEDVPECSGSAAAGASVLSLPPLRARLLPAPCSTARGADTAPSRRHVA